MIQYRVAVLPELKNSISHLVPSVKSRVRASFRFLEQEPLAGKPLERELTGFRSYPIPPYRIVYRVDASHRIVQVVRVGHRRDVYEVLVQKLNAGEIREKRAIYVRR